MPNNRQLASMILLALFAAWVLTRGDLRQGLGSILRSLGHPKLLAPILLFVGYVVGLVLAGQRADLWDGELTTDTVFWFAGTAFVMFVNMNKVAEEKHYVRRVALRTVGLTVFIQFVANLFVLPLWAELLVQPVLVVLTCLTIAAGTRDELASVGKAVGRVATSAGLALLVYALARLVADWSHIAWVDNAREFALPIWLTIGLLPALLAMSVVANYELAWVRLTFASDDQRALRRSLAAVFLVLRGRVHDLAQFAGGWPDRVAETGSLRQAVRVVRDFRHSLRSAAAAEATRLRNLRDYARVDGENEYGARLDRREFRETQAALRWLAVCEMGQYNNRGGRYRPDLLNVVQSSELGLDPGIHLIVRADGQAWYAWRRTITGWHFGIGAAGPPPDQWLGDGELPPDGFPGTSPWWGTGPFGIDSPNWDDEDD